MSLGVLHLSCTVLHLSCTCPALSCTVLHLSCTCPAPVLHCPARAVRGAKYGEAVHSVVEHSVEFSHAGWRALVWIFGAEYRQEPPQRPQQPAQENLHLPDDKNRYRGGRGYGDARSMKATRCALLLRLPRPALALWCRDLRRAPVFLGTRFPTEKAPEYRNWQRCQNPGLHPA